MPWDWKIRQESEGLYKLHTFKILLPTNANLGRIMKIMEMDILLLEPLFVLNIQIFDINIWLLVMSKTLYGVTKMVSKSRNHVSTASRNLLYFTPESNNQKRNNQIKQIIKHSEQEWREFVRGWRASVVNLVREEAKRKVFTRNPWCGFHISGYGMQVPIIFHVFRLGPITFQQASGSPFSPKHIYLCPNSVFVLFTPIFAVFMLRANLLTSRLCSFYPSGYL